MATVKKIVKAQNGIPVKKSTIKTLPSKKEEMIESEMFPGKMIPKSKSNYYNGEYNKMIESGRPKAKAPTKKAPKAKDGKNVEFGMLSVKAGIDKNPNPTAADRIAGATKKAKSGMSVMKMGGKAAKQAAIAIAMKKAGKTPKKKMQYGGQAASMVPAAKYGKSMKKK